MSTILTVQKRNWMSIATKADFVFNLAGVNRPENQEDFMKGNFGFASQLLDILKKAQ